MVSVYFGCFVKVSFDSSLVFLFASYISCNSVYDRTIANIILF